MAHRTPTPESSFSHQPAPESQTLPQHVTTDQNGPLWIGKSITDMLTIMLAFREKYDNGAGGFKNQMWRVVKDRLEQQGHVRTTKQVQNKFTSLKTQWMQRQELLNKSGFELDPETNRVTASVECWARLGEVSS